MKTKIKIRFLTNYILISVILSSSLFSQTKIEKSEFQDQFESEMEWKEIIRIGKRSDFLNYFIDNPRSNLIDEILDSLRSNTKEREVKGSFSKARNVVDNLMLMLNESDFILLNRQIFKNEEIIDVLTEHILNISEREDLPSKSTKDIVEFNGIKIPSYYISISSLIETPSNKYSEIVIQVKNAINNVRNYYSLQIFELEYDELDIEFKVLIDKDLPYNIDILFLNSYPTAPPQK